MIGRGLHHVAYLLDAVQIHRLIIQGHDPNKYDADGSTPLHWLARRACVADPIPAYCSLIDAGADPNALTQSGTDSVLTLAIESGHQVLVERLLADGADPNKAANGVTPLMRAAAGGKVRIAVYLMRHGAKSKTRSSSRTASDYALTYNRKRLARIIDQLGTNGDAESKEDQG